MRRLRRKFLKSFSSGAFVWLPPTLKLNLTLAQTPTLTVRVCVKVKFSFRVGGNHTIAPEENCPLVRVRVWLRVSYGVGGNFPRAGQFSGHIYQVTLVQFLFADIFKCPDLYQIIKLWSQKMARYRLF